MGGAPWPGLEAGVAGVVAGALAAWRARAPVITDAPAPEPMAAVLRGSGVRVVEVPVLGG